MGRLDEKAVWEVLEEVKDPEIPVVSVVEMGIVREVEVQGDTVRVIMTPTFTGCPALHVMRQDIEIHLKKAGAENVQVDIRNSPPWSSNWITPEARVKLKQFGLAPPPHVQGSLELSLLDVVRCPYCESENTEIKNSFGPTLCRAIFYCNNCQQPFEQFKPI
jgi:ring-1,2-phenylacetyl-CoA epoxidase subunit PaaD